MKRSKIMLAMLLLLAGAFTACGQQKPKVLVVYYSHTGNTRIVAEEIQRATGADIFEIKTVEAFPANDKEAHDVARAERAEGIERPLAGEMPDISPYDLIFIGTPNWFSSYATPVGTFAKQYDWTGKQLCFFQTYKGNGGKVFDDMSALFAGAKASDVFLLKSSEIADKMGEIQKWAASVPAGNLEFEIIDISL